MEIGRILFHLKLLLKDKSMAISFLNKSLENFKMVWNIGIIVDYEVLSIDGSRCQIFNEIGIFILIMGDFVSG